MSLLNICGAVFNLEHALDCKTGGLVTQCHNEVRDALGDLASIVFNNVLNRASSEPGGMALLH